MKKIIRTEFPDLVRFLFLNLRLEKQVPFRDNFFLIKELSHKDHMLLDKFNNYVIISNVYFTDEWGKKEIFDYCLTNIRTNRKNHPDYNSLSKQEFERYIKVFYLTGIWEHEGIDSKVYDIFANLENRYKKTTMYFESLQDGIHSKQIMLSMLTFISKSLGSSDDRMNISQGYLKVLTKNKSMIERNFKKAILNYSLNNKLDSDIKVLRFIQDLL